MFSIRKVKNRLAQHGLANHRPDNAFHPRLEALEGRALPSVTVLSFNRPLVVMIGEPSFNFSLTIRIDIAPSGVGSYGALSSRGAAPSGVSGGQMADQTIANQTAGNAPSSAASQDSNGLAALSAGSAVPTTASNDLAFASSVANVPSVTPTRPVAVRPSVPEQVFLLNSFIGPADQPPLLNNVSLPATINTLTPDFRLVRPQPAVQAIVNRMEFIGSAVTVADNYVAGDQPSEPSIPQPRPANPPLPEIDDVTAADSLAGLWRGENASADDASLPDGMDPGALWDQIGEERPILTPELVTEVATLAACAGGFRMQKEVAAWRGALTSGTEFVVRKRRSRP